MRSALKWIALGLVVFGVLVVARDPLFWQRYLTVLAHGDTGLTLSFYEPRERVPGGNQPPAPRESPAAESMDVSALEAAADYAGAHGSRALIVSRHGYIVFERYWQGTSYESVHDAKELGRVVAALATGAAISARKIGWPDEPIGNFISAWRDDPRGQITVRNLMQLSSGLAPSGDAHADLHTDLIADYLRRPLGSMPGQRWVNQSVDSNLLVHVIEKATGQRYAQYLSQSVWQRIGAADAWLWLDHPGGAAHVDRGFLVQQGDWIRVGELLLKKGNYQGDEVLVPRWVPQLLEPSKSNAHYGAFIHLGAHAEPGVTPYIANDVFVVEGGANRLWIVPSLEIVILRTAEAGTSDWDDARIPNLIVRGTRDFVPPAARPGADLRQLVPNH